MNNKIYTNISETRFQWRAEQYSVMYSRIQTADVGLVRDIDEFHLNMNLVFFCVKKEEKNNF